MALAGDFTEEAGILSGEVAPVPHLKGASLVVQTRGPEAVPGLFIVDLTQPGVQRSPVATIDCSQPCGSLRLSGALPALDFASIEALLSAP